jgi:hypothetical protein
MADAGRRMSVPARDGPHDKSYQIHRKLFANYKGRSTVLIAPDLARNPLGSPTSRRSGAPAEEV